MLTADANVFISGASVTEFHHQVSRAFLGHVSVLSMPLYCPTLLLPQVAGGRKTYGKNWLRDTNSRRHPALAKLGSGSV